MTRKVVFWSVFQHNDVKLHLAATDRGLCRVALPNEPFDTLCHWVRRHIPSAELVRGEQQFDEVTRELQQYFDGNRVAFGLALDLHGTRFQTKVWQALTDIPFGEVRSYSDVAEAVGRPTAVRSVAAANGQNPLPIVLPCHRVIGKNGSLTGFRGGLRLKQRLLQLEGVSQVGGWGHARFNF